MSRQDVFGWSYPAGCSGPPEDDYAVGCDVCQQEISWCECPECPVCDVAGDPDCFGTHVGKIETRYEYTLVVGAEHFCEDLGTYSTQEAAEDAGKDWLTESVASSKDREDAERECYYEVLEPEEVPPTKEDILKAIKEKDNEK
tara:strand:- start:8 stop:436 length:429 start_codon:yes stop_codon:yes gene_type:complete